MHLKTTHDFKLYWRWGGNFIKILLAYKIKFTSHKKFFEKKVCQKFILHQIKKNKVYYVLLLFINTYRTIQTSTSTIRQSRWIWKQPWIWKFSDHLASISSKFRFIPDNLNYGFFQKVGSEKSLTEIYTTSNYKKQRGLYSLVIFKGRQNYWGLYLMNSWK